MHDKYRMVENIFEELEASDEWFHNLNALYYKPEKRVDFKKATVEEVRLKQLVEFKGFMASPVKHITFQGFVIRHVARTFMETKEPMLHSDWTIFRGGALMLTGTENIQILDCKFDQVGGNAIFVNTYNRGTLVKETHIHDTGASGICFVGDPKALHNPLFEYGEKNKFSELDLTSGSKTENYPALSKVEDCLIHGIGTVEHQPAGVQIDMAVGDHGFIGKQNMYDNSIRVPLMLVGLNLPKGKVVDEYVYCCTQDVMATSLDIANIKTSTCVL